MKIKKIIIFTVLIAIAILSITATSNAASIENGDFETGALSPWVTGVIGAQGPGSYYIDGNYTANGAYSLKTHYTFTGFTSAYSYFFIDGVYLNNSDNITVQARLINTSSVSNAKVRINIWTNGSRSGSALIGIEKANIGTTYETVNCTFTGTPGNYTISIVATQDQAIAGTIWTAIDDVRINGVPASLNSSFTANPISNTVTAPCYVTFNSTSQGDITNYNWDLGNGVTSTNQNVSVVYTETGTYNVSLNVSNNNDYSISYLTYVVPAQNTSAYTVPGTSNNPLYGILLTPSYGGGIAYIYAEATCQDPNRPFDKVIWTADGQRSQTTGSGGLGGLIDYTEFRKSGDNWQWVQDNTGVWTTLAGQQINQYMYNTAYFKTTGTHTVTVDFYNNGQLLARCTGTIIVHDGTDMSTQWINVYDAEYEDLQVQVENVNVTLTDTITGQIIERTLIAGYDVFTGVKGHRYNIVINKSGYNTIDTYFTWPTISGTSEDYYLQNTIGLTAPEGKTYLNLYVVDDSTGKSIKRMTFSVYDGTSWNSYNTYEAGYATAIVPKNTSVRYVVDSSSMYTGKTGDVTIYENAVTLQVRLTYKPGAPTPTPLPGGITAIPAPTGNLPVPTLTPAQEEENIESTRQMLVQSLPGIASLCILVVFVGLIDMIMPKRRK